jgi:hypothetical protein
MERLFQLMSVDEVMAMYEVLMSEERSILVVSQSKFDLVAVLTSLLSLMYPFEWQLSCIPFLVSHKDSPDENML